MKKELALALPFYNEEKNVRWVVEELIATFEREKVDYELALINNGSWDKTDSIIDELVREHPARLKKVVVHPNEGYGWGIRQAFKVMDAEYIGYTPGDGQVPADDIAMCFRKAQELDLDFVQGSRIRKDQAFRRINTIAFNTSFHWIFGCPVKDVGSNPKIFKSKWLQRIHYVSKDWWIDGETMTKIHRWGGKLQEFPVTFRKRELGKSKINLWTSVQMLINMLEWKIKLLSLPKEWKEHEQRVLER